MSSVEGKLEYIDFICDVEKDVSLCDIDMVIRIDKETYDCEKCALLDTIDTVRIMCPLIMKTDIRVLK